MRLPAHFSFHQSCSSMRNSPYKVLPDAACISCSIARGGRRCSSCQTARQPSFHTTCLRFSHHCSLYR
ncbi:Uncharacterised protein [Segatella copri]|nr:Uncharacterised protein [Segatella copri]